MLTEAEAQFVIDRFTAFLAPLSAVRATAVVGLPGRLQEKVADGVVPGVLAASIIQLALADGWTNNPPVLAAVLAGFDSGEPKVAELRARIQRTPPPNPADPLAATILDTLSPFLDRSPLRRTLRGFGPNSHSQILVVNGPPKSGRSYTRELLTHYCRAPSITLCCVKKSSWTEPQDVAADLVSAVGGDSGSLPPSDTVQERWLSELARWVLREAANAHQRALTDIWFLMDGFGDDLSQPLRYFIAQLADRITNGAFAVGNFRLILLEFRRSDLTVPIGKIVTDDTSDIQDPDIEAGVRAILATKGAVPGDRHPSYVDLVIQGLPAAERRLPLVNLRVRALLDHLDEAEVVPIAESDLFARFEQRLGKLDREEAESVATAILAASGKVPASDFPAFVSRVLQDLPGGDQRRAVIDRRLSDLAEVLR